MGRKGLVLLAVVEGEDARLERRNGVAKCRRRVAEHGELEPAAEVHESSEQRADVAEMGEHGVRVRVGLADHTLRVVVAEEPVVLDRAGLAPSAIESLGGELFELFEITRRNRWKGCSRLNLFHLVPPVVGATA